MSKEIVWCERCGHSGGRSKQDPICGDCWEKIVDEHDEDQERGKEYEAFLRNETDYYTIYHDEPEDE